MTDATTARILNRVVLLWLIPAGVVSAIVLGVLVWAIPHGFDWTDEAWLYSLIGSDRVSEGEAWGFQHVLHPLFSVTGESVIVFRALRLVGYVLLSALLLPVALWILRASGRSLTLAQWLLVLVGSQVGTFVAWSYPPRYLGYNELSSWLTQIGAALLMLVIANRLLALRGSTAGVLGVRTGAVVWAALGAITVFLFAAKVTSGAVFAVFVVAALFIRSDQIRAVLRVVATASGAALSLLLLITSGFPLLDYLRNLLALVVDPAVRAANAHPVGELVRTYAASLGVSIQAIAPALILLSAAAVLLAANVILGKAHRFSRLVTWASGFVGLAAVCAVFFWNTGATFDDLGYIVAFTGASTAIVVSLWATHRPDRIGSDRSAVLLGFAVAVFSATPFIGALGTNNAIVGQLIYSSTLWTFGFSLVLVMAMGHLVHRGVVVGALPGALIFAVVVVGALAVRGDVVSHPYRTAPYATQHTPTDAPFIDGLLLTQRQSEYAAWLVDAAGALNADKTPTVALESPGALLVFNNSPFASPWINASWPASYASVATACTEETPSDLIVLQPESAPLDGQVVASFAAALESCDLEFPRDFEVEMSRQSTEPAEAMTIWRLHS